MTESGKNSWHCQWTWSESPTNNRCWKLTTSPRICFTHVSHPYIHTLFNCKTCPCSLPYILLSQGLLPSWLRVQLPLPLLLQTPRDSATPRLTRDSLGDSRRSGLGTPFSVAYEAWVWVFLVSFFPLWWLWEVS